MIQILFGVLFLAAALVILMGAGDTLRLPVGDIFPLIGFGGTGLIVGLGALLIARGLYGRKLKVMLGPDRAALQLNARAIATTLSISLLALVLPLTASAFNVLSLSGFPMGYYLAAQGAPILMVIFVFLWLMKEQRSAGEGESDE